MESCSSLVSFRHIDASLTSGADSGGSCSFCLALTGLEEACDDWPLWCCGQPNMGISVAGVPLLYWCGSWWPASSWLEERRGEGIGHSPVEFSPFFYHVGKLCLALGGGKTVILRCSVQLYSAPVSRLCVWSRQLKRPSSLLAGHAPNLIFLDSEFRPCMLWDRICNLKCN